MDLSFIQIAIVLVIALLVFGPKRLPELARQVGKGLREVRRHMNDVSEDFKSAVDEATPPDGALDINGRPVAVAVSGEPVVDDADILDGIVVSGDTPPAPPAGPGG